MGEELCECEWHQGQITNISNIRIRHMITVQDILMIMITKNWF